MSWILIAALLTDRVDALAKPMLARPIAGISVAVSRDGQPILTRGYGMANVEHSVPVTPDTLFHIDSVSKNILAAVLLQLVDQGKVNLDDDVTKFIPEAPLHGRHITVRQLLNHTSGIYSFTSLPDADGNERLDLGHAEVLALFKERPPDFEPGTSWRYDNSAFYMAGMVVERVTKEDYGAYVRKHVFEPLGMTTAQLCDARTIVPHLASGYARDHGALVHAPFISWRLPWAAGAICATPTDLLKWQAALDSGRVLSAASLAAMRAPTSLADGSLIDYGLGTRLGSLDGHRAVGHTGSGGGFAATVLALPDDHLTVAVLINTEVGATPALLLASHIARSILDLPEKKDLRDLRVPDAELAAIAGTYDSDEGPIELFGRDGKLHFRGRGQEGVLMQQSGGVYAFNEDIEIHFLPNWSIVYTGGLLMDPMRRLH